MPSGWVAALPVALPNVIWALVPSPAAPTAPEAPPSLLLRLVSMIESAGRVAVFAWPFFLGWHVETTRDVVLVATGVMALGVYFVGWGRFFLRGRAPTWLFAPLGPLPVPLAIAPVVYFLVFAALARSPGMATTTALFGAAHVHLSLRRHRAACRDSQAR